MRNARRQTKYPVNRPVHARSIGANSISPMKNTILLSSAVIALVFAGCNKSTRTSTAANDPYPMTTPTVSEQVAADTRAATDNAARDLRNAGDKASDNIKTGIGHASSAMSGAASNVAHSAHMTEWRLNTTDIQADLDAKREIVRTKSAAGAPTGSMDKSTVKSAVEGRLKADTELSAFKLQVDPGKDGEVNLDGKVNTADQVGKAIALALDTDGVTRVASKIELDKQGNAGK